MLSEKHIRALITDRVTTRLPSPGAVLVTTPFLDNMGDPIQLEVRQTHAGYILTDQGAVAGLLFSTGNDHPTSQAHRLVISLASVYDLTIDYDEGLLTIHATEDQLSQHLSQLATAVTAIIATAPLL